MEASRPLSLPDPPFHPNVEAIKRKLLQHGVNPTPKILHNLRKKELQKYNRGLTKRNSKQPPPLTDAQKQTISEESNFQLIKSEYRKFAKSVGNDESGKLVGRPWERLDRLRLRELASESAEYDGEKLNSEHLRELGDIIECENDKFSWLLDNDVEIGEGWFENDGRRWDRPRRSVSEAIKLLIDRLSATELTVKNWKFIRMMRYSGLQFTEAQLLRIVEGLGNRGRWRDASSVVEWVYNSKEHRHYKSRFVYTKLLSVLGRARKPREALQVFNLMRGDAHIYPDMAAYHSLAVTLGQAGCLKELLNVIELMKGRPKKVRNMRHKGWSPELQPDIVVFNAVLNACVPTCQWKGVSWVFQQLRKYGLRPNGASYGLAMEVMLKSGKYNLVHEFFGKMKRSGEVLRALTYKVLVKTFWEEGKVDEAVAAVRDMEGRGVIGTASVYYELARCLCFYGRPKDAILEIEKLRNRHPTRPLAVAFTGMIMSSMDGGQVDDCVALYEHSKTLLIPDIGLINAMLKVYGRNDLFHKAKELFEETRRNGIGSKTGEHDHSSFPKADAYTFSSMLEASASALQWEYFEYVYKEMVLFGHRINQHKHSALLVEASRAGKPHLLEHASDSILEAGEIPPVSFFTEMACQATIRNDYERAVNIINTMAHAPFQVSLQEWIELFESNSNRIDRSSLHKLHQKIISTDLAKEATALNLSRALELVCESCKDSSNSVAFIRPPTEKIKLEDGVDEEIDGHDGCMSKGREKEDTGLDNAASLSSSESHKKDATAHGSTSKSSPSFLDEFEFEHELDLELIVPSSEEEEEEAPESETYPSAYEILESWKKF